MPALAAYTNVLNTSLVILEKKGFRVWSNEKQDQWFAEKNGWDFMADDPLYLLGLIAIFEHHKPSQYKDMWWELDKPNLIEKPAKLAPDYKPVWKK
jgi:hypothetical protein